MLHSVILIHKKSGVCLFGKNYTLDFDSVLFSGFLTAVQSFAEDLKIGRLTNFITNDKVILISTSEDVVASLIIDLEDSVDDWLDKAYEIAERFQEMYNEELSAFSGNISTFEEFSEEVSKILESEEKNLMLEVAKWAKKEFGGELQVNALLTPRKNKQPLKIDILLDRGDIDFRKIQDKIALHRFQWLKKDLIFIRVIDGIVGRGEIKDFMESIQNFGGDNPEEVETGIFGRKKKSHKETKSESENPEEIESPEESESGIFPFFPKMAVIVGRDFSSTVYDLSDKLYKNKNEKHFIQSKHLMIAPPIHKMDIFNCWVEYWKWQEPYPERIFK